MDVVLAMRALSIGRAVRLPNWRGFWALHRVNGMRRIIAHQYVKMANGEERLQATDIRLLPDAMSVILSDDWEVARNAPELLEAELKRKFTNMVEI